MPLPDDYDVTAPALPRELTLPRGPVLCFAPHPDDEVIGPGGALRHHRLQGDPVRAVLATDGRSGDPDGLFDAREYPELRRRESRAALARLDVTDVRFWGYPDSAVVAPADLEALIERVRAEVLEHAPRTVYAPWEGETNSDHRALCAAVVRGLERCGFDGLALGYEVWTPIADPQALLDITPVERDKRAAIACYATQ